MSGKMFWKKGVRAGSKAGTDYKSAPTDDNTGNFRHQNVDLYQRIDGRWFRIDLPSNGHTIINKAD